MLLKTITLLFILRCVESQPLPFGYHLSFGIPRAAYLRYLEAGVSRIVGGSPVTDGTAFPYQAGIVVTLTTGWTSVCGGALVSNTRVLTAAHCWYDGQRQARSFTVVLGSLTVFTGGTRITTSDVAVHPSWNTNDITNDIAVARINRVQYNNNIQSIPLPTMAAVNEHFAGMTATASGFGKTSDWQNNFPSTTNLHHISLKILSNVDCQKSFDLPLHGSHLCTSGEGRVGTCDGDSGGPLTVVLNTRRTLVGIVSFGLGDACQAGYPSVFTRVTAFLNWINSQL